MNLLTKKNAFLLMVLGFLLVLMHPIKAHNLPLFLGLVAITASITNLLGFSWKNSSDLWAKLANGVAFLAGIAGITMSAYPPYLNISLMVAIGLTSIFEASAPLSRTQHAYLRFGWIPILLALACYALQVDMYYSLVGAYLLLLGFCIYEYFVKQSELYSKILVVLGLLITPAIYVFAYDYKFVAIPLLFLFIEIAGNKPTKVLASS